MKKNLLTLLFLSSLIITGCGDEAKDGGDKKPAKQDYTKLFSLECEEEYCLVHDKVKEYSDRRNEERLSNEDKEHKIYDLGKTTQVKNYKGDYDISKPVELKFTVDDSIADEEFTLRYWLEGKDDEAKEVPVKVTNGKGSASLVNLFRSSNYEWEVVSSSGKYSNTAYFSTGEYVRILTIDDGDIQNFRDCGGWKTLDGKRIKQGLVYRGYEWNDHRLSNGHSQNVFGDDDPSKKIIIDELGIREEIDLRSDSEADISNNRSPINYTTAVEGDDNFVGYVRLPTTSYLRQTEDEADYKKIFEDYFTKADERPCYYHCYGGADRTGTIDFLLGGILGMSFTDLVIEYEATTFYGSLKEYDNHSDQYTLFNDMLETVKGWSFYNSSKDLKEACEKYLVQTCGVSTSAIAKIREIMLEDID